MFVMHKSSALYLLVLLNVTAIVASYKIYELHKDHACFPHNYGDIDLGEKSKSAVVVRFSSGKYYSNEDFNCTFLVKRPSITSQILKHHQVPTFDKLIGVFAVVQNMTLRRDPTSGKCIDFVRFKYGRAGVTTELCDTTSADEAMRDAIPSATPARNAFVSETSIEVTVLARTRSFHTTDEVGLTIVFTAYKECRSNEVYYGPCDAVRGEYCIYHGYFTDKFVNCPYDGCYDEGGCARKSEVSSTFDMTAIVTGIGSLVLSFVLFVACFTFLRKVVRDCLSGVSSSSRPPESAEVDAIGFDIVPAITPASVVNSNISGGREENKDLPPSYSSLFPETVA